MRFQISKVVSEANPEIVIYVLENCLREISLDVVRNGSEIIFRGLGPSPRMVNPRDITIFRVETEHDRTIIRVDVTFQPSCLLGESPQDAVVRSKLDSVFEQMNVGIAVNKDLLTARIEPAYTQPLSSSQSVELASTTTLVPLAFSCVPASALQSQRLNLPLEAAKPALIRFNPLLPSITGLTPRASIITILSSVLLALCIYFVHNNRPISLPSSAKLRATANPIIPDSRSRKLQRPIADESLSMLNVNDPRAWLQNWVAALRTRDPIFQASFYANPVDNYFGRRNVSTTDIIEAKENDIRNRSGLWTVKLEEIVLTSERGGGVTVHFVRHYIVQTGPVQISERFVRSELRLKRLNGKWKIVVEDYFT